MHGRQGLAARILLVAWMGTGVAACATTQARTAPAPAPALDVPVPPARVVIPVTVRVPEPPPAQPDPADPARPPATSSTTPPRPPDRPATPPAGQTGPPPVLQPTSNTAAIELKARDLVTTARRNLARVDRSRLQENARDQYDTAARFLRMADEALGAKNYLWALQLAESAAALAGALVKGADPASAS